MTHHVPTESTSPKQPPVTDSAPSGSIPSVSHLLEAPEALELYLADVKQRREANRQQRQFAYWRSALVRLGDELEAARTDQDNEIVAELMEVLASFESALAAITIPTDLADPLTGLAEPEQVPEALSKLETSIVPENSENIEDISVQERTAVRSNGAHPTLDTAVKPISIPPPLPIPPPVSEAARAELAARCQDLRGRIIVHLEVQDGDLTHALRSRALFCEGQALALNPNTPEIGKQTLTDPLDDLAASPMSWAEGYPFSLRQHDFLIWNGLAGLYEHCADASESLDWYVAHEAEVPDASRVEVLNAISAVQQRLYRSPDGTGRRDDAVHAMYRRIRMTSEHTGFIRALSPSVGDAELIELAARCGQIMLDISAEVEERRARTEREAKKEAAIVAVVAWEEALEGRTVTSESLDFDRQTLCALLDDCLKVGVSPTNIKVRTAILDTAPVLLENLPKYEKFLEAVITERTKRSLEAVEIAPPPEKVGDDDFHRMVRSVVQLTQGKRIVMLGGKSRPQVAQELSDLLHCEVAWHDSDSGDKFAKFASKIKKADIVLLLKNFASHEIFYGSKDAMAADGKHFVVLPSGYGVRQVVFQLSEYVGKQKGAAG